MTPTIKPNYQTTFHRDGTVSYWSVYRQQWERKAADAIADEDTAAMRSEDRERIQCMTPANA